MSYSILIACEDFRVGGAQTFVLRLAQALSTRHQVYLYSHYHDFIAWGMVKRLAPNVEILSCYFPFPADWIIRKIDRLCYKLRLDFSLRERLIAKHILHTVKKHRIDVVHSNMFKSDLVVVDALRNSQVPVIITMHGNYESFLAVYLGEKSGEYIHNYKRKVLRIFSNAKAVVYLTEKNLRVFDVYKEAKTHWENGLIVRKIYNGFAEDPAVKKVQTSRRNLSIPNDALIFGMVARGIPEKGWKEAIEAFIAVQKQHPSMHLILIGSSDYLTALSKEFSSHTHIHFIGFMESPLDWVRCIDVGLLPTVNDCLPNSIVEYLYAGKPVISTNVGEIPQMISYRGKQAGFIIELDSEKKVKLAELIKALKSYSDSPELLTEHQALARLAFQQFDMEACVTQYINLFIEASKCRSLQN